MRVQSSRRMAVTVVTLVGVGIVVTRFLGLGPFGDPQGVNRFAQSPQYVDPQSGAARAFGEAQAAGDPAAGDLRMLAEQPTGIWLTPETYPAADVAAYVSEVVRAAEEEERVPVLVVYGVPERDCRGGLSAGGLPVDEYLPWIDTIAGAAEGSDAVVILEPDALASAVQCGIVDERVDLLRAAVDELRGADVTTYVDGGHSDWVAAPDMTAMLREVGTETVRGFSTNVSNFQTTPSELAYANAISESLGGAHFVIDTGRNAGGATDDWCNPPGRSLGTRPGFVDDGSALDGYLWIKPPGESDGSCGGGPTAGVFWTDRARELVAASR